MDISNLYDRPDLYDLIAPRDPVLERFYVEMALERGRSVLDLACGSGRLSIPLARAGAQVVGGDASPKMLQRARTFAGTEGVEVEFIQLDMRAFDLSGRQFDTVVVAANSVLHLHTLDDFRGFFRAAARHLSRNGRLVFDAFVPSVAMLSRGPDARHPAGYGQHDTLGGVTVEETIRYDPIAQISHVDWYWSTETQKDFWRSPLTMRQIFPQEMPLLVELGGLHLAERFGDFDRRPFTTGSHRQVCVCTLP